MTGGLHLLVSTPATILADEDQVEAVHAEDASGAFGILPGHEAMLAVLPPSVLRWRTKAGEMRFCAHGGGVLTVADGRRVTVACRQGTVGEDLARLGDDVARMREEEAEAERGARVEHERMRTEAVRHLLKHLRADGAPPAGLLP